ncbi:MAG: ABC transporter permease [Acidimicrobiaceae bacterium]|nr:ABC transporter permease [Acidimicrobiaceae bacterium]
MDSAKALPVPVALAARNLVRNLRTPMLVTASLLQPVIWLVLFSQTFKGLANTDQFRRLGYGSYLEFLLPGMLILSMLFTALQSGIATVTDIDTGVMDKLLISPTRRISILFGRVGADAITMLVQGGIILALAVAMGARPNSALGAIALLAIATVFGVAWAGLSNLIALRTRSSELTMVGGLLLTLPALFLTPAFFPRQLLPGWLQGVSNANPATYVIETGQRLMSTGNSWAQDGRTLIALAVTAAVLIPASIAAFRATAK